MLGWREEKSTRVVKRSPGAKVISLLVYQCQMGCWEVVAPACYRVGIRLAEVFPGSEADNPFEWALRFYDYQMPLGSLLSRS